VPELLILTTSHVSPSSEEKTQSQKVALRETSLPLALAAELKSSII
jgi:hypothetical protein